jgi:hypothetical protein
VIGNNLLYRKVSGGDVHVGGGSASSDGTAVVSFTLKVKNGTDTTISNRTWYVEASSTSSSYHDWLPRTEKTINLAPDTISEGFDFSGRIRTDSENAVTVYAQYCSATFTPVSGKTYVATITAEGTGYSKEEYLFIDEEESDGITYDAVANGTARTTTSTSIALTFSAAVTGLTASDIALVSNTGAATTGTLTGSGTSWMLGISSVAPGILVLSIDNTGIESSSKSVLLYSDKLDAATIANSTALREYISAHCAGGTAEEPKVLPIAGAITQANLDTVRAAVNTANTYVIWDLSGVTGSLTATQIGATISSITDTGRDKIKGLVLPDGLISIGNSAFSFCTTLASVTIPEGVTSIGNQAFYGCTSLASVTIPDGGASLGSATFYGCTSLANVTIPDGVTSIGNLAFNGCSSLASVTIPASVTSIDQYAFSGCSTLASVTVLRSATPLTTLGSSALSSTHADLKIYVPAAKVEAYKALSEWNYYSSKIQAIE